MILILASAFEKIPKSSTRFSEPPRDGSVTFGVTEAVTAVAVPSPDHVWLEPRSRLEQISDWALEGSSSFDFVLLSLSP